MSKVKDKETGAIFDDFVYQCPSEEYDTDAWTQVCDKHAKKFGLIDSYFEEGAGHGICGIVGCYKESDHYYDFFRSANYVS